MGKAKHILSVAVLDPTIAPKLAADWVETAKGLGLEECGPVFGPFLVDVVRPPCPGIAAEKTITGPCRVNELTNVCAVDSGRCSATSSETTRSKRCPRSSGRVRSAATNRSTGSTSAA